MSFSIWDDRKIEDVVERVFSGGTPSTTKSEYWGGKNPWLSSGETKNTFILKTEKNITDEGVKNSSTKLALVGDVVIASAGQGNTRGQTSYCKINTYINQSLISIRADQNKASSLFLFYNLSGRYNELRKISDSHSIRGSLTTKIINKLLIKLPPLTEQKAIANILSSLDENIEVNNQINKKLEEMAQAIFKQWFVDFEFPNEEGKPYKSSGGPMVESELGMIPRGWKVRKLTDLAEFQNGYAFYKIGYCEEGIKVIDLGNVNVHGNFVETPRDKYISLELYNDPKLEKYKLNKDDLIVIMTDRTQNMNILGKTAKVPHSDKYILNQRVGRIRAFEGVNVNFLLSSMNSDRITGELKKKSLGTAQRYFNTNHIKELAFIVPPSEVMALFSELINPIYNKMLNSSEKTNELEKLKNLILPKLMSGEIRVPIEQE